MEKKLLELKCLLKLDKVVLVKREKTIDEEILDAIVSLFVLMKYV